MKHGASALVAAVVFWGLTGVAAAQPVYYGPQAYYYGGRVAPPAPLDGALPSYEVAAILHSGGYLPLGGPIRRGDFYVVAAMHPSGDDGRVVIDAYSGRVVRFVPGPQAIRSPRGGDEMVMVYEGPDFPPPAASRAVRPPPVITARSVAPQPYWSRAVPRPPAPVPHVASRTPSAVPVTPKPRPQSAPPKPETAQAPPVPAPVESKPAATSPTLVPKPPLEKGPTVQPTRPLPPVQTLE